jgi:hypothetical protein
VPYTVDSSGSGTVISLSAKSREELVRDLVTAVLEAAYGGASASAAAEGQIVPIQATGGEDAELLTNLAADTLRAVRDTRGMVLPPRWLAFDEKRVTAMLPVAGDAATSRVFLPQNAVVERPLPDFRGRIELQLVSAR